jgi:sec-independent protein translocase protein TatB
VLGFSFGEIMVISLVALVAVGPQKLPGMLKTMGQWVRKLRQMTMDVRQQTGIDEMLRAEGIQLSELRSLMRGYHAPVVHTPAPAPPRTPTPVPEPRYEDPYGEVEPDPTREYPLEGADAYGALPDDLLEPPSTTDVAAAPGAPAAPPVVESSETAAPEEEAAEAPVVVEPTLADGAVEVEPEPVSEARPTTAPPSAPRRSVPPPPPSRATVPRPSSAAPPPPRRAASGPPRPEPPSPAPTLTDSAAVNEPPGSDNANGNG